jgi:SUN family beta-glucosidase
MGNYAPMNLGAGARDGTIWLALFPNHPSTSATLDFNVRIDGDKLNGVCKYEGGMYYDSNGSNPSGCTVSPSMAGIRLDFVS